MTEAALILNAIAIFAAFVSQVMLPEDIARLTHYQGGMSGAATIVIFFSTVHRYGLALALLLYWERRSVLALAMVLFGATNYLYIIVAMSRRGPAIEFVFIVVLTYAMARQKRILPIFVAMLFVGGTLWSTGIGEFRSRTIDFVAGLRRFETADFFKDFSYVLEHGGLEVENAVEVITDTYETQSYEYGKLHWNKVVHGYFPGQIWSGNEKDLQFTIDDIAEDANTRRGTVCATATGMADCFTSFGYFGCLKYVVIGFVMGRWYRRAFRGDLAAQLAYSTLMSAALHTVSHGTVWFVNEYIHMAIFSYPVLHWARKPAQLGGVPPGRRRPNHYGVEPATGVAVDFR